MSNFLIIFYSFNDSHSQVTAGTHTHTHRHLEVCFCHKEKPFAHFDGGLKERLSCLSGFFITECNRAKKITAATAGGALELFMYFLHGYL